MQKVEAEVCALKPKNISHAAAASTPLVAITCAKAFNACKLSPESRPRVLVLGGAGGVGLVPFFCFVFFPLDLAPPFIYHLTFLLTFPFL